MHRQRQYQLHNAPSLNGFGAFFVSTQIYLFIIALSFPYRIFKVDKPRCRSPPPPFDFPKLSKNRMEEIYNGNYQLKRLLPVVYP